jgi:hypothetical protein
MEKIKFSGGLKKMAKKTKKKNTNPPDIKSQAGIFQLAGWKTTKTIPAKNDFDVEREVEHINLCLTAGIREKGEWKNIKVWFRASQFANLKEVVDDFAKQLKKLNGVDDEESD